MDPTIITDETTQESFDGDELYSEDEDEDDSSEDSRLHWTTPKIFPVSLDGVGDGDPILESMFQVQPPPMWPHLHIRMDTDSIYGYNEDMEELIEAFGSKTQFAMSSKTSHWFNSTGSRYCIDCSHLSQPPSFRNEDAGTVPMNWFPNTTVCSIYVKELSAKVHFNIYFLGVDRFKKDAKFTELQMGVINAALNTCRILCLDELSDINQHSLRNEFVNMYPFESAVGGKNWSNYVHNTENHLSFVASKLFWSKFPVALAMIAADDEDVAFETPETNGMKYEDATGYHSFTREHMVGFAKQLSKRYVFAASAAGIKNRFNNEMFYKELSMPRDLLEEYQATFHENLHLFIEEAQIDTLHHFEVETQDELPDDAPWPSEENPPPFEAAGNFDCFDEVFPSFGDRFEQEIHTIVDDLSKVMYKTLQQAFDKAPSGGNESSEIIYFDFGVEVSAPDNTSMLVDCKQAKILLDYAGDQP